MHPFTHCGRTCCARAMPIEAPRQTIAQARYSSAMGFTLRAVCGGQTHAHVGDTLVLGTDTDSHRYNLPYGAPASAGNFCAPLGWPSPRVCRSCSYGRRPCPSRSRGLHTRVEGRGSPSETMGTHENCCCLHRERACRGHISPACLEKGPGWSPPRSSPYLARHLHE